MTGKHRILKQKISSIIKRLNKSSDSSDNIKSNELNSLLVLIGAILQVDGNINEVELRRTAFAIKKEIPAKDKNEIIKQLKQKYTLPQITKAASELSHLNLTVKELLLQSLIEIAGINNKYSKKEQEIVDIIRIEFSISEAHAYELWKKAKKKNQGNSNFIGSGAALVIVLVIIVVFILAASFFLSVIFGLILAYFFLPIQFWFKNTFFPSKLIVAVSRFISIIMLPITYPLKKLSCLLPKTKKLDNEPKLTEKEQKELCLIKSSCRATVLLVISVFLIFIITASIFSTTYFAYATKTMAHWAKQTTTTYVKQIKNTSSTPENSKSDVKTENVNNTTSTDSLPSKEPSADAEEPKGSKVEDNTSKEPSVEAEPKDLFSALLYKLESVKPKLEKIPFFQTIITNTAKFLKDPENIKKIALFVLEKAGGVFSYTAGAIGMIFMLLMNLVLTFFFFAFFLSHMAWFNDKIDEKATGGEHIVNGMLNSGWLPSITKDSKKGAIVILDNIFARLRSWIRGYLTIIIIETVFYVTTFLLVGVPYGIILGILAGLTILLPYIGPMISVLLTLIVCLAVGTGGMVQIIIVILLYTFMNGIVEQLFIYPAIVGKTLGLNEFETIVLVLLGGILFGIPGMIFAVPVASILKYLIPQVYKFWQDKKAKSDYLKTEVE